MPRPPASLDHASSHAADEESQETPAASADGRELRSLRRACGPASHGTHRGAARQRGGHGARDLARCGSILPALQRSGPPAEGAKERSLRPRRRAEEASDMAGPLSDPPNIANPWRQTRRWRLQSGEHGWQGDVAHMGHLSEPLNGGDSIW